MNTLTLEKMNKLIHDITSLNRTVKNLEDTIKCIKETGNFYTEESVLVFERQVSTNDHPSAYDVYIAMSIFKGLLETPVYKDGHSVYDGECLLVPRNLIATDSGEDCHVKFIEKTEAVQWEEWEEDNTYLQIWNECKPTEEQCKIEIEDKEKELECIKLSVINTEAELKDLMEKL